MVDDARVQPRWWTARWDAWWAEWWSRRRVGVVVCAGAIGGVIYLLGWPLSETAATDVQGLTSLTVDQLEEQVVPGRVDFFTNLDFVLMTLVTVALVVLMSLRSQRTLVEQMGAFRRYRSWWPPRKMPSSVRWKLVGGTAALVYFVSDLLETWLLRRILHSRPEGEKIDVSTDRILGVADEGLWMAWLHNAKWLSLAVAVLVAILLLGRRTPNRPGLDRRPDGTPDDWNPPDHVPDLNGIPDDERARLDWAPSPERFGVSVSGGGVRSASFALGVFHVLRERGLLGKARYVCSVSGGTYATSGMEYANRTGESPEVSVQRLRRRLNYLLRDTVRSVGSLLRILFGLLLNLVVLYLVIFVVARPVGWLIGSPVVQEGLRYDGPVVVEVVTDSDDPDEQTKLAVAACGLERPPDDVVSYEMVGSSAVPAGAGSEVASIEFEVAGIPRQCVRIDDLPRDHDDDEDRYGYFGVDSRSSGLIKIDAGMATVIRQPALRPKVAVIKSCVESASEPGSEGRNGADVGEQPDATELASPQFCGADEQVLRESDDISALVEVELGEIGVSELGAVATTDIDLNELLTPASVTVSAVNPVHLRDGLDVVDRHWKVPVVLFAVAVFFSALTAVGWVVRERTNPPRGWGLLFLLPGPITAVAFGALGLLLVLPWLAQVWPEWLIGVATEGPSEEQTAQLSWFPTGLQPILAWPLLAVATVLQMRRQFTSTAPTDSKPKKRNSVAFVKKITSFAVKLAVGLVLLSLFIGSALGFVATGALNGPFGNRGWVSSDVPVLGWRLWEDLTLWFAIGLGLLVTRTMFQANSWSLTPIYRNGLRWAYMGDDVEHGSLDGRDQENGTAQEERAGYLHGTNAELVICCAANVVGGDRAPTGRKAVSFTASRTWIGGPELGWLPTGAYLDKLGPARRADVSIPSMTAVSGAAASPAMGKGSMGAIGSVFAILNVRLGGWLPHPQAVKNMSGDLDTWNHTPGWTYYVREVLRRHTHESAYVYVTDGGHWENLGLVESLRRGCSHIVVASAAGDGAYSHGTLAEAIEIARTDLDVDIDLDSVWRMRPKVGADPASVLPSGRQFVRQDGDNPILGRAAPIGFTFGTFTRNHLPHDDPARVGKILLIEATMVDGLPVDVHSYAEGHAEFPNISTGDQFFDNRDFESYRMLGVTLTESALDSQVMNLSNDGVAFEREIRAFTDSL